MPCRDLQDRCGAPSRGRWTSALGMILYDASRQRVKTRVGLYITFVDTRELAPVSSCPASLGRLGLAWLSRGRWVV